MERVLEGSTLATTALLILGAALAGLLGSTGRAQEMHRATAMREGKQPRQLDAALTLLGWLVTLFLLLTGGLWLAAPLALVPVAVAGWALRREPVARRLARLDLQPLAELKFAVLLGLLAVATALVHVWLRHTPASAEPGLQGLLSRVGLPYAGGSCALVVALLSSGRVEDRRRRRRRAALLALARARALSAATVTPLPRVAQAEPRGRERRPVSG